ncbi:MAG TPA: AAA family ATPase, partial [Polyangiales bacterium]|nr:AAA family ATPase [Polyangiales bacterium]
MKLLRLELRAFGPFQDQRLDFTQDRPAVQLIYGPNEAGKSTALRAVHDLFYGIPERTGDAHRHRMSDLRIAALLRDARERELFVVRRKGNKDTLLDASGKPLPGAEASWITAGVAEPHFSSFFGLSYATLEHDAKDLLSGSGDLGESLFGAGLGGRAVRDVLTALAQESDAIYKRRGTTLPFNQAVSALDEAKRALRESAIDAKKFDTQQREILEAEQHDDALRKRREHLVKERSKLERARRVLPLFAERTRLQRELRLLGEVRWLPPEASAQRMQAQETVRLETLRIEQLDAELARLAEQRAALDVPEKLLALDAATMVALRDRIGSCKRARAELPGKRDAARAAREAVEHGAVALAGAASLAAEREAPYAALVRRIREHVVSRAALVADVERTERDLTRARAELRTLRGQQGQPLPARESVEQAAELQASIDHELAKLAEQERDCATRRARVEREIAALEAGATLPAESELHAARQRRDAVLEELASAGDARAREASLAALRPRIAQADRIADDLRREADRIASLAALRSELATCQREHAMVEDARAATHARLLRAQSDW